VMLSAPDSDIVHCWAMLARKSVPLHDNASPRRFDRLPDDPLVVSLPRQGLYRVMRAMDKLQIQGDTNRNSDVNYIHRAIHADYYSSSSNARLIQVSFVCIFKVLS
jgi:hypothetical protein